MAPEVSSGIFASCISAFRGAHPCPLPTMSSKKLKRALNDDDTTSQPRQKKTKVAQEPEKKTTGLLSAQEIDFPRGGGSSFTPAEYKAIRTEATKEADDELRFEVRIDLTA